MKNQSILFGVVGLLVGALLTWSVTSGQKQENSAPMPSTNTQPIMQSGQQMSMDQMVQGLKTKSGENFDRAFISEMVEHHKGAINMAQAAKENAKHDEIKKMADDIISAQTNEINQMKQWQKDWGYQP